MGDSLINRILATIVEWIIIAILGTLAAAVPLTALTALTAFLIQAFIGSL